MSENDEKDFKICPKCHIGYEMSKNELYDHLIDCDGRKDIITTRFYKIDDFLKKEKQDTIKEIYIETILRPITR